MLSVSEGTVKIRGMKIDLMAEFTQLAHHLIATGAFTEQDITLCIDTAKMSEEEIQANTEKVRKEFCPDDEHIFKMLGDLFGVK